MASVTFDTLKFVEKLKDAGVLEAQAKAEAEALVTAFSQAMDTQLATKTDINRLERELLVVKWMVALVLGGILTLILKAFFPFEALTASISHKRFLPTCCNSFLYLTCYKMYSKDG